MKYLLTIATILCTLGPLSAQKHILKVAPIKLINTNIGLMYETVFGGRAGFQLETQIKLGYTRDYEDFKNQFSFLPRFDEFDEVDDKANGTITRSTAVRITPEYRIYFGKKGPKGLYMPLFLRYINEAYSADISYLEDGVDKGGEGEAKLVTTGAGLGLGYQFVIKNRVTLDFTVGLGGGWTSVNVTSTLPGSTVDERNGWMEEINEEVSTYPLLPDDLGITVTEQGIDINKLGFFRPMVRSSFTIGVILN